MTPDRDAKTRATRRAGAGAALGAVIALAIAVTVGAASASCSLTGVKHDACTTDTQCAAAFGAGSTCQGGYCSDPATMPDCNQTGKDGRPCYGCAPASQVQFHTACTGAACQPFDNTKRLTKLGADGGLPALP